MKAEFGDRVLLSPWFAFEDSNGPGRAQADAVLLAPRVILECKLSHVEAAERELRGLYGPIAERVWGDGWAFAEVCLHWSGAGHDDSRGGQSLDGSERRASAGGVPSDPLLAPVIPQVYSSLAGLARLAPGGFAVLHLPDIERLTRWAKRLG